MNVYVRSSMYLSLISIEYPIKDTNPHSIRMSCNGIVYLSVFHAKSVENHHETMTRDTKKKKEKIIGGLAEEKQQPLSLNNKLKVNKII